LECIAGGVKLTLHGVPDRAQRTMLLTQLPDSHSHRVETEVRAVVEIQDDGFSVELPKNDIVRDAHRVCDG